MIEHPTLGPETIARHLREARDLRGAAIRALFASMARMADAATRSLVGAIRGRLHRRRLVFAPRLACQ
ncbi:MAG: hypothetical protein O3A96_15115 [Proteobacteria bacterium]|nr:hypothetical protein [Pseudomonadota bacterium]